MLTEKQIHTINHTMSNLKLHKNGIEEMIEKNINIEFQKRRLDEINKIIESMNYLVKSTEKENFSDGTFSDYIQNEKTEENVSVRNLFLYVHYMMTYDFIRGELCYNQRLNYFIGDDYDMDNYEDRERLYEQTDPLMELYNSLSVSMEDMSEYEKFRFSGDLIKACKKGYILPFCLDMKKERYVTLNSPAFNVMFFIFSESIKNMIKYGELGHGKCEIDIYIGQHIDIISTNKIFKFSNRPKSSQKGLQLMKYFANFMNGKYKSESFVNENNEEIFVSEFGFNAIII